jgi:hypothetical protein
MHAAEIERQIADLLARAAHARVLRTFMLDDQTQENLAGYAQGLEQQAADLEKDLAALSEPDSAGEPDESQD